MNPTAYAWLIPLLPLMAFVANILFGHLWSRTVSAAVSISLLAAATVCAALLLVDVRQGAADFDPAVLTEIPHVERSLQAAAAELAALEEVGVSAGVRAQWRQRIHDLEQELGRLEGQAVIREPAPDFPYAAETPWIAIGGEEGVPLGVLLDPLAAVMAMMVALVSLFIHLFSVSYMAKEARYHTFFAYLSLFSAAMLGMVLSKNLFHVLLFWELMGLMSYLLIGFFYRRAAAQQAMKKAFLTTKVADVAFIVAVFWIYREFGTLDIPTLAAMAPEALFATTGAALGIGLLLLVGAMGKSAQFPLHVWLLDAMEGPTPVSAMIHAATMVAAGVFLLARTYPLLEAGGVLPAVAVVGVFTALFAATLALAFADIKKILAWSTVSQLGLMLLALGALGWVAAVFHLLTHAFFKAVLFLAAGSMIHSSGTQDIFRMNALGKFMPSTRWTFVIGAVSLAGLVPFAGFWSKDEILLAVKTVASTAPIYWLLLGAAYAASLATAVYIGRAYFIAFEKPASESPWDKAPWNQGGFGELALSSKEVERDRALDHHPAPAEPHESPWPMTTALWVLAIGAVLVGLLGSPLLGRPLQLFVFPGTIPHLEPLSAMWLGFAIGTAVAVLGIVLAWALYGAEAISGRAPTWLTQLLQKRWYLDHAYYALFARPQTSAGQSAAWIDRRLVDGAIDFGAWLVEVVSEVLRRVQSGRLEHYAWTLAAGAVAVIVAVSAGGLL